MLLIFGSERHFGVPQFLPCLFPHTGLGSQSLGLVNRNEVDEGHGVTEADVPKTEVKIVMECNATAEMNAASKDHGRRNIE